MDGSGLPVAKSTCPYCGVGCGVLLRPDGQGGMEVRGDPDHPANKGKLCSKGSQLGQTLITRELGTSRSALAPLAPLAHGHATDRRPERGRAAALL